MHPMKMAVAIVAALLTACGGGDVTEDPQVGPQEPTQVSPDTPTPRVNCAERPDLCK